MLGSFTAYEVKAYPLRVGLSVSMGIYNYYLETPPNRGVSTQHEISSLQ